MSLLRQLGIDWYALFVVAVALGWFLFLEAYERLVIRPRQRIEDRQEITQLWHDAFAHWERARDERLSAEVTHVGEPEPLEHAFDTEEVTGRDRPIIPRGNRCAHDLLACRVCRGWGGTGA